MKTLKSRLDDYSSSEFEVLSSDKKSSNYTIVSSKISSDDGKPEIKIDWKGDLHKKIPINLSLET